METEQNVKHDSSIENPETIHDICSTQPIWIELEHISDRSPFLFHYPDIMQITKSKSDNLTSEEREKIIETLFKYQHPVYKRLAEI